MRITPRRRYFAAVSTGLALLAVAGGSLHYAASRSQRRALERRLDRLEADFSSMQKRSAVPPLSAVGSEARSAEPVEGYRPTSVARPRVLGSARTGAWLYTDVRYPDGYQARYYLRTNSPPARVREWVRTLASDAREHAAPSE